MVHLSMHYRHDVSLEMGEVAPIRIVDKSTDGHNIPGNSKKVRRHKKKKEKKEENGSLMQIVIIRARCRRRMDINPCIGASPRSRPTV